MKKRIINAIDDNRDAIISCGEYVLNNPELGFKEFKTSEYVSNPGKPIFHLPDHRAACGRYFRSSSYR